MRRFVNKVGLAKAATMFEFEMCPENNKSEEFENFVSFLGPQGVEEIRRDPHNVELMRQMKKYLEKSAQFMVGAK